MVCGSCPIDPIAEKAQGRCHAVSLQHFIQEYGYWALLLGTILEGETIMLLAGFAASQGHLSLPWVWLVGFLGAVTGDQTFFYLGRWKGKEYLATHPRNNFV